MLYSLWLLLDSLNIFYYVSIFLLLDEKCVYFALDNGINLQVLCLFLREYEKHLAPTYKSSSSVPLNFLAA